MTTLNNKPVCYDFIKSCRDMRAEPDNKYAVEGWAIREGSLVIGISPSHVVPTGEQYLDQLELKEGKFYMVEHIYSDMWAFCVEFSTIKPHQGRIAGAPNEVVGLGFVPLCAVTLAANYSSFLERCREYQKDPDKVPLTPTNGGRMLPPARIQSLAVSREMDLMITKGQNDFNSKKAFNICEKFRPIGEGEPEYEPSDRIGKMKSFIKAPRRAWKKLTSTKLHIKGSWVGPDAVPLRPSPRPRKKLIKTLHRSLDITGCVKRLCDQIRGT